MFQDIQSTEIAEVTPGLDAKIRRLAMEHSKCSDLFPDYSLRIVFEAYEITGIWIDKVFIQVPGLSRSICIFFKYTLEGMQDYGRIRIEYLSRDDAHTLKQFLQSVQFEPAPRLAPWYMAQMDLASY